MVTIRLAILEGNVNNSTSTVLIYNKCIHIWVGLIRIHEQKKDLSIMLVLGN